MLIIINRSTCNSGSGSNSGNNGSGKNLLLNPLKPNLIKIICEHSVLTSKKTSPLQRSVGSRCLRKQSMFPLRII
jgi:hypothetical protein